MIYTGDSKFVFTMFCYVVSLILSLLLLHSRDEHRTSNNSISLQTQMKEKKNDFWRLDLLEVKFTNVSPRFKFTKKLINAHNNSQLLKKLPNTRNEALQQILALKSDLFEKKYHGAHKKLSREVLRMFRQLRSKLERSEHLDTLFNDKDFVPKLVSAKIAKIITTAILTNKELKTNPPSYILGDVANIITNKSNPCNPTSFFIKYCQSDKAVNGYISKLWNIKEMKTLCSEIDWSFRKIRGNLSKEEIAQRAKSAPTKSAASSKISSESDSDNSDNSDIDGEGYSGDEGTEFDQMVAGSDDDDEDEDELIEGSDEEDLVEKNIQKKEKSEKKDPLKELSYKLPELATGYFSGGSEDEEDVDNDKVVKEATTARKNRRGQRARQKIWEQKYGSKANHVQQENKRIASERERKQQEFEERQRKRDLKAKAFADTPDGSKHNPNNPNKLHPSWEARKLAEQKQKDIKFTGKKITFD